MASRFAWHAHRPMPTAMAERFWKKVEKSGGCWRWIGRRFGVTEYGAFTICVMTWRGPAWRPEAAHRLAYELSVGPIPAGKHILHSCDNRQCVRPDHLRAGTGEDNRADMVRRFRIRRGTEHHWAKLTERQVLQIRKDYAKGSVTMLELAERYGVEQATMSPLLHGKTWTHVGGPIVPAGVRLQTKLTGQNVAEIRRLHKDGMSIGKIAPRFGITKTHVSRLINRHPSVWKNVP